MDPPTTHTSQWRMQDYPGVRVSTYDFPNCMKTEKFGAGGGGHSLRPLDPPINLYIVDIVGFNEVYENVFLFLQLKCGNNTTVEIAIEV